MAELQFPNIAGAFQQGQQLGTQQRMLREGEQRRNTLASLAQQAYSAPQDQRQGIIGQAVGVDPEAGFALEKGVQGSEDARTRSLVNAAKLLTSAPDAQRPGLYQQMRPGLAQFGLQLPDQYDDTVAQTAQALVQAYGAQTGTADQQNFQSMTQGFTPEQIRDAQLVRAGLKPRAGLPSIFDTGAGVVGIDRAGYNATPINMGGGAPDPQGPQASQPNRGPGSLDINADLQQFASLGIPVSSTRRSPDHNREVGGVGNSYHLTGEAVDMAPQNPQQKEQARQFWQSRGYQVIDEGDHLHAEPPARGMTASQIGAGQQLRSAPKPPSEIDQERLRLAQNADRRAEEAASLKGQLTPVQRQKVEQTKRKETQMLSSMDAGLDQTVKLIDDVLANQGSLGGVTGMGAWGAKIPGSPWADVAAKLDTLKARSAFGSLQEMRANSPTGGALGAVSERELYLLQNAETQLQTSQSPESLVKALKDYKQTLLNSKRRMRAGVDEFYQEAEQASGPQSAPSGDDDALIGKYLD